MRISFDVDDTLVCAPHVPAEQFVPWLWRAWYPERLRAGTWGLMRELAARGCEVWVYTTSYRSRGYIRGWFRSFGVRIADVVNQERHERVLRQGLKFRGYPPSKFPPAFGIDLHVDDSEGVALEGREHGFAVLVVEPGDPGWAGKVLRAAGLK